MYCSQLRLPVFLGPGKGGYKRCRRNLYRKSSLWGADLHGKIVGRFGGGLFVYDIKNWKSERHEPSRFDFFLFSLKIKAQPAQEFRWERKRKVVHESHHFINAHTNLTPLSAWSFLIILRPPRLPFLPFLRGDPLSTSNQARSPVIQTRYVQSYLLKHNMPCLLSQPKYKCYPSFQWLRYNFSTDLSLLGLGKDLGSMVIHIIRTWYH